MRKYGFEKHLPIPVPLKYGSGEYMVCLSQNMSTEFCDIFEIQIIADKIACFKINI
jgi:hypothetical protein